MVEYSKQYLFNGILNKVYTTGSFELSSGTKSNVYFDCKNITYSASFMPHIANVFISEFRNSGCLPNSVGGLTVGATSISCAISYRSAIDDSLNYIDSFVIRKTKKRYGMGKIIDGCIRDNVAIVDDVVTSGNSILFAVKCCLEHGFRVSYIGVLIDRNEGDNKGINNIIDFCTKYTPDTKVFSIFSLKDFEV